MPILKSTFMVFCLCLNKKKQREHSAKHLFTDTVLILVSNRMHYIIIALLNKCNFRENYSFKSF